MMNGSISKKHKEMVAIEVVTRDIRKVVRRIMKYIKLKHTTMVKTTISTVAEVETTRTGL